MNTILHWPQIVWIVYTGVTLFVFAVLDGKPRTGAHSLVERLIWSAVIAFILYSGGFFG